MLSRLFLSTLLIFTSSSAVADERLQDLPDWLQKEWIQKLPGQLELLEEQLEQKGATGSIYLKNYVQCMDDQQALNQTEKPSIGQFIDNALAAGNECTPLLNDMLKELSEGEANNGSKNSSLPENSL